ncbi:hypothetical protein SAMN05216241_103220 [Limimonas halophila]|uniref:Uncharacterized protein n=1 Tax=Limimonas halophila TaxID=1082479 RepID=A0A1G7Q3Z4_9PROT|nr:hypothetical protein SAMN05216241_103220 [Limimonas halophila]
MRVPARRGDAAFFRTVEDTFDLCPDVEVAEANARTGSVLIHHTADADTVWHFAAKQGLFVREGAGEAAGGATNRLVADARRIDSWFKDTSDGDFDLATVISVSLLGLAVVQVLRGQIMAPAITLAWYGGMLIYDRWRTANRAQPAAETA